MFAPPAGLTLDRLLGRGSSFEVALVRGGDGLPVVAKRLRPSLRGSPEATAALLREGAVLARVFHPAVPRLLANGSDAAGPYLLETFVTGASFDGGAEPSSRLAHRAALTLFELQRLGDGDGPLDFVHGDLCPEHLIAVTDASTGQTTVSLVDFGAATLRGVPSAPAGGRGTLPFAAPELCRGETEATQATDRYALAVVLASFLLGGARLCRNTTEAAMLLEIGEHGHDSKVLVGLPGAARRALEAHLSFDPRDRPDDLADLVDALAAGA
ncbi:MAG: protein kinase [Myxococcales bacterium]|nr:protein kinase [Myxococcales bacterium]